MFSDKGAADESANRENIKTIIDSSPVSRNPVSVHNSDSISSRFKHIFAEILVHAASACSTTDLKKSEMSSFAGISRPQQPINRFLLLQLFYQPCHVLAELFHRPHPFFIGIDLAGFPPPADLPAAQSRMDLSSVRAHRFRAISMCMSEHLPCHALHTGGGTVRSLHTR
jgi:hypothetical protein